MNKKLLSVAIAGAMATPMAAQAVKYKLSGQVNRVILFQDDGEQSDIRNTDNIASGTRWRLRGSEDLGNGMKVGFYYEMQTSSAPSSSARPDQDSDGANGVSSGGNIRQANVWFSGKWGKLSIGQLDGAGNGAAESDLSGTAIAGTYSGRTSFTAGMRWRTSMGGTINAPGGTSQSVQVTSGGTPFVKTSNTPLTAGDTYSAFDSFSRYDGIRYDSPALGPVTISASIGNDAKWEVAGRVDTSLGGGQLSAALFYGEASGALDVDSRYGGSASFLFSQGTSISGHYTSNEDESDEDSDSWSLKLGHKWGPNAVSIGYGESSDVVDGFEDDGFNIGYVRSLKKANTELYASFFHQELDTPTGTPSAEDINVFAVGARVKFN